MSHVDCLIQADLLQFSNGEAVKIFLASVSSGIHPMWPTGRNAMLGHWTIADMVALLSVSSNHSTHGGTI